MSFKAILNVGGKQVNILNVNYDLAQEVDATGRPSSVTRGGRINLTVESTGDSFFFEWMTNNFERKKRDDHVYQTGNGCQTERSEFRRRLPGEIQGKLRCFRL